MGGGQRQARVLGQWIHRLHQALAESDFTGDQSAVVILNRAGNDLSCGSSQPIDQHYDRIIFAAVTVLRNVALLGGGASVVRDDDLSLLQELIGNTNTFAEQAAGIATQVEDQTFQIAERIQSVRNFTLCRFVEAVDVHVADAWLDQEVHIYAVARNLVANQRELHRLLHAFPRDADVNGCAFGALQHVGNIAGTHVLSRFAIDGDDDVTRMNAGLVRRRPGEGVNDDDFVVARADCHANAVVFTALVFTH